jgi:hypothetical protein
MFPPIAFAKRYIELYSIVEAGTNIIAPVRPGPVFSPPADLLAALANQSAGGSHPSLPWHLLPEEGHRAGCEYSRHRGPELPKAFARRKMESLLSGFLTSKCPAISRRLIAEPFNKKSPHGYF